jgi:hypothetical protein
MVLGLYVSTQPVHSVSQLVALMLSWQKPEPHGPPEHAQQEA